MTEDSQQIIKNTLKKWVDEEVSLPKLKKDDLCFGRIDIGQGKE